MADGPPNTQTAVGEWSTQVYKLSDFLDRFQLPQIIKVNEGYLDEKEEKTVGVDDILILHKYETIPKVIAISYEEGEECGEISLPLTCAVKVDRVPEEFAKSRLSGAGILQQLSKVKFVRVTESDTEIGLIKNDKLKVKYKTVENRGSSFSFILSTLTKPKQLFRVTENCRATFQAILDPNEYRIAEVIRNFGLPNYVYMVANVIQGKLNKYSSQPVLKLQRTFTETCVIASTLEDSSSIVKLPRDLEVTLRASVKAEKRLTDAESFCGKSSNEIEKEERTIDRADSRAVYEDMSNHTKETEIASLQNDQMKRAIKKDAAGKLQVVIPNNYTPTPLARALSNRNGTYDFPAKTTETEFARDSSDLQKTPLYDAPRGGTNSQSDQRNIFDGLFKNKSYCQEYARMEWLKSSNVPSSAEDELEESDADHIYQEITFRELPAEMRGSFSVDKEALKNTDRIFTGNKQTISSESDSAPANFKFGGIKTGHSNTYQIDRIMTDKSKPSRRYQIQKAQTDSDETVYENCNFLKARLSECDTDFKVCKHEPKTSPQRRATSAGVVSLKSSLGGVISDTLLKNKLSAMKVDSAGAKIPPPPPPRTSSRKPDTPDEPECSSAGNDRRAGKSRGPLPEPPKPNVRRSASAAATMGFFKDKKKFSDRPLPNPKARSQSLDSTISEQDPSAVNQGSNSKAPPEKSLKPKFKPLVPLKAVPPPKPFTPMPSPIQTRVDGKESLGSHPKNPRESGKCTNYLDQRSPAASPPKPKAYVGSCTRNKSGNELVVARGRTNLTASANRSHSLNELNTNSDDTFVIPDDLRSLGVAGVAECLKRLKMEQLVEYFQENQIDGDMLVSLDDDILHEMGVEKFHRLKLVKFIGGWRPMM